MSLKWCSPLPRTRKDYKGEAFRPATDTPFRVLADHPDLTTDTRRAHKDMNEVHARCQIKTSLGEYVEMELRRQPRGYLFAWFTAEDASECGGMSVEEAIENARENWKQRDFVLLR